MRVNTKGGVPPCDRRFDRRKVALAAVAALFLFATTPAKAGVVDFEIVQSLSSHSFFQAIDLTPIGFPVVTTDAQFPDPDGAGPLTGSDVTSIFGNILADLTPGFIELVSGGQWTSAISTTPGVGGIPGNFRPFDPVTSDPAAAPPLGTTPMSSFGVKDVAGTIGLREVLYGHHGDWSTGAPGPRPLGVGGSFAYVPGADFLLAAGGRLAFSSVLGVDTGDSVGDPDAIFGTAGLATPSWDPLDFTAGPLGTLTLPIESTFSIPLDLSDVAPGAVGTVTFSSFGVIIATPKVPEPSTLVLLGFGVVGLLTCGLRMRKRKA